MRTDDSQNRLRSAQLFILCCNAGIAVVLSVFAFRVIDSLLNGGHRFRADRAFFTLVFAVVASTIPSTISFLPVWFLLRKKKVEHCRAWLLSVPVLVAIGFCVSGFEAGIVLGGPASLVLTAVLLHFRLPDYFEGEHTCHACGYDLTGNISGRCPECGTAILQAG